MLRAFAIGIAGVGVFACLPLMSAWACDDDRYPCPIRSEALIEETVQAPDQLVPDEPQKKSAQPQKKAKQPASTNDKAHAKRDREAPRAPAGAKVSKPAAPPVQAPAAVSQKAPEAAPAAAAASGADEQPLNDESRGGSLVATAGTAWPVSPTTQDAAGTPGTSINTADGASNAVQMVDPNEINEIDRAGSVESVLAQLSLVGTGRGAHCRIRNMVLSENEIHVQPTNRKCGLNGLCRKIALRYRIARNAQSKNC